MVPNPNNFFDDLQLKPAKKGSKITFLDAEEQARVKIKTLDERIKAWTTHAQVVRRTLLEKARRPFISDLVSSTSESDKPDEPMEPMVPQVVPGGTNEIGNAKE